MSAQPPLQARVQSVVETMKTIGVNDETDALALLKTKARWAARCLGPFFDLSNALLAGLPAEGEEVTAADRDTFNRVMGLHKDLPHYIAGFQGEPDAYDNFVEMMVAMKNYARADDTHMVKYAIVQWIPLDPVENPVTPSLVGSRKDNRGWYHPATAKALTPLSLLEQFERNPTKFQEEVQNGMIAIGAKEYPSFLYPDGTVYNCRNIEEGLFRGHIFIRALRALYTGESSAQDGYRNAPKGSQAEINDMKAVFAEAVATAAVQAHFGLSSLGNWNEIDKSDFDYFFFFENCVKLFTMDPDDDWVVDTLKFLTSQLPSLKRRSKRARDEENGNDQGEDQTALILERRAARKVAKEQEAQEQAENLAREQELERAREHEAELLGREGDIQEGFNEVVPHQVTPPPSSPPEHRPQWSSPSPPRREVLHPHSSQQQTPSPPSRRSLPPPNALPACRRADSRPPLGPGGFRTNTPALRHPRITGNSSQDDSRTASASTAPSTSTSVRTGGGDQQPPVSTSAASTKGRKKQSRKKKW